MLTKQSLRRADVLAVIGIVSILAMVLLPVFTRARQMQASRCHANMNCIGKAIKMYLSDWEDTYPTQRLVPPMNSFIAPQVRLSDPDRLGPDGQPIRYEYGINWVEALYPYIEVDEDGDGDAASVWVCPAAKPVITGSSDASVTYAFNANLIELPKNGVKSPQITMMARELDRLYNSVLKPGNPTPTNVPMPTNTFLNQYELVTYPKYALHNGGSNILFADGHVKCFSVDYYPRTCQWDNTTMQWFNYVTGLPDGDPRIKSIAVSP